MTEWFRSWHGAPTDPKWRTVARRAGVRPGDVAAVAWVLLDRASQARERGSIAGYDAEVIADALGYEPDDVVRIIAAMHEKEILQHDKFASWQERQPSREDASADRVRAFRERQKRAVTQCNAVERDETQGNAPEKSREESETEERIIAAQPESPVQAQARAHVHAHEADELLGHLVDAAGLAEPLPASLEDISPIADLVAKGYSLRDRILPVIRARRRASFGSWAYFVPAIVEAEERGAGIAAARKPTPADAVWIDEGSPGWLAATKARGKPPIVTYRNGSPGAWVRRTDIIERVAS